MTEPAHDGFHATPVNRFLGMRLVSRSDAKAVVALPVRPDFVQEHGVVHGGMITALADTAAVYLIHPDHLETGRAMTSIDAHVSFLRPGRADGGDLVAEAEPIRIGRRVAVCRSQVRQDDRLVAVGTFTYYLIEA